MNSPELFQRFKAEVIDRCAQYAKDNFDILGCYAACMNQNYFRPCYMGNRPNVSIGVKKFFWKFAQEKFPYLAEKPNIKKLKIQPNLRNMPVGLVPGEPVPKDRIPACDPATMGATGSIIFNFVRRRRQSRAARRRLRRKAADLVTLLLAVAAVFSLAGLGCDAGDEQHATVRSICPETGEVMEECPAVETCPDIPEPPAPPLEYGQMCCRQRNNFNCANKAVTFDGTKDFSAGTELHSHELVHNALEVYDLTDSAVVNKNDELRGPEQQKPIERTGGGAALADNRPLGDVTNFALAGDKDGINQVATKNAAETPTGGGRSISAVVDLTQPEPTKLQGSESLGALAADAPKVGDSEGGVKPEEAETAASNAAGRQGPAVAGVEGVQGGSDYSEGEVDVAPPGADSSGDAYLKKIKGKTSLFQVINRRYSIWSRKTLGN